jgi:Flp pilus assembly pilin Flp
MNTMNESNSHFVFNKLHARGQGLVEYAILITLVGLIAIAGLALFGGSIKGGLIKVCAALGNDNCQAAEDPPATVIETTPTASISTTSTAPPVPTATLKLSEPEPTRGPVLVFTSTPTAPVEMDTLRIKVVISGKDNTDGIQVVIYGPAGEYVTEGVTDDKGNLTLSVPEGDYTVSTFYDGAWQTAGPFSSGSKQNVIHR